MATLQKGFNVMQTRSHSRGTQRSPSVVCSASDRKYSHSVVSIASAALILASTTTPFVMPPAAFALETVSVTEATAKARPLPQQEVDKSKIWIFLTVGAMGLFILTSVAENNEQFFPAISRANRAMKKTKEMAEKEEQEAAKAQEAMRLQSSVQAGLSKAKERTLSASAATAAAPVLPVAPVTTNIPQQLTAEDAAPPAAAPPQGSGDSEDRGRVNLKGAQGPSSVGESLEDIRKLEEELARRKNAV